MTVPMNDLRAQYLSIKDEVDEAIRRVLSNGVFEMGEELEAFEEEFVVDPTAEEKSLGAATQLTDVQYSATGTGTNVTLTGDGSLDLYEDFVLDNPNRIVIDIQGVSSSFHLLLLILQHLYRTRCIAPDSMGNSFLKDYL